MFGCRCLTWSAASGLPAPEPAIFSLPAPLPQWPPGQGFSTGTINLGELEIAEVTKFEFVWGYILSTDNKKSVSFYKPIGIPDGFSCLGYYCQPSENPLRGFVLVAKQSAPQHRVSDDSPPALSKPLDYTSVWCTDKGSQESYGSPGYFWLPEPPKGYKALGFVVTSTSSKPNLEEVRCIREDLTDEWESCGLLLETKPALGVPLRVWKTRPCHRGLEGKGISVGTFFCNTMLSADQKPIFGCLKNSDPSWCAMPNLDQIHALINHYGPTLHFHPEEKYLPSSVSWFFESGALLYRKGESQGEPINATGSNLPTGGSNDHEYWLDLPSDEKLKEKIKHGDLKSAELYAHIKPALGGTFTDIAMWVFCPFNGPANLKVGPMTIQFDRIGRHVSDWEHFTLRISNFSGQLYSVYFSQHSGGVWVDAWDLEFEHENKARVYSSKNGHASFPHPGMYLQGSAKVGVGIRNDCAMSQLCVDSSTRYQIVAAEYLKGEVKEPQWLQFMREWGPVVVYDSRKELDKAIKRLPSGFRSPLTSFFNKLPVELYKEEGPTGPKEKNNWFDDERW